MKGHAYELGFEPRTAPHKLDEPLKWKKPRRIFVNSMSDLFHESFSDEYIDQVFAVMLLSPRHTYQVLTKRAMRVADYLTNPKLYQRLLDAAGAFRAERPELNGIGISDPLFRLASWIARALGRRAICGLAGHRRMNFAGERFCTRCWRTWE